MKRRLRKKRLVGEFRQFGIHLDVHLRGDADVDSFFDEFLEEAVEGNGLQFGGGFQSDRPVIAGFVELGGIDNVAANRSKVHRWLELHVAVETFSCGEPVDANGV